MKKHEIKKAVEREKERAMPEAIKAEGRSRAFHEVMEAVDPPYEEPHEAKSAAPVQHGQKAGSVTISSAEIEHRLGRGRS